MNRSKPDGRVTVLERHFTVGDLAQMWKIDQSTVRRIFDREPGVLCITTGERNKRRYETRRIPESVAERVYRRLLSTEEDVTAKIAWQSSPLNRAYTQRQPRRIAK